MRRGLLVVTVLMGLAPAALAGNAQQGDNTGSSGQDGSSASGDAIAGPSAGFSAHGDIRVRMTNRIGTDDDIVASDEPGTTEITNDQGPTSVASGAASGGNESSLFVGLQVGTESNVLAEILGAPVAELRSASTD